MDGAGADKEPRRSPIQVRGMDPGKQWVGLPLHRSSSSCVREGRQSPWIQREVNGVDLVVLRKVMRISEAGGKSWETGK